jgi:hypothetical protein
LSKKDKNISCIVTGEELYKNGNNGASKERKKLTVLQDALCKIYCMVGNLDLSESNDQHKIDIKKTIKDARAAVKAIDEESSNEKHENDYSGHHPAKKAVFGPNDLVLPMKRIIHSSLENNNISPLEAMILGLYFPSYMDVNSKFINNGGQDILKSSLADIVVRNQKAIRKIPEKELRRKLMRGIPDPGNRARSALEARGVIIPREGQY